MRMRTCVYGGETCVDRAPATRAPRHTYNDEDRIARISVVIADDHSGFRQALADVIQAESDMCVVASVGDGAAALDAIRRLAPVVAVLDVRMPVLDGIEIARAVAEQGGPTRTVIMTMHWGRSVVERVASLPVSGYLAKETALLEVVAAIRCAAAGEIYVAPVLTAAFPRG
jgi:DNA-binding NarL/FixJ family response regulator